MPRVELIPIYLIPGKVWDKPIPVTPKAGSYGELVKDYMQTKRHPIFYASAGTAAGWTTSTTKVTIISITGKGIAMLVGSRQDGLGTGYIDSFTIDGVEKGIWFWTLDYNDTPNVLVGNVMLPFSSSFKLNGHVSAGTGRYFMTFVLFSKPASELNNNSEKRWVERVDDIHDKEIVEYYDEEGKLLHRIECLVATRAPPLVEYHPLERIIKDLELIKAKLGIE